jgi:hypothetical protein
MMEIDIRNSLSIIIVTHCTDRLKKFKELSPPSNKMVTAAYGSLMHLDDEDLRKCPKVLCYDRNSTGGKRDALYCRSLERFSREYGFDLRIFSGVGLFNVLDTTIEAIGTPYILWVEHDWVFKGAPIKFKAIIEMMNNHPNIHSVRFNKRDNQINGHDFIMGENEVPGYYPLMKTSSFSNNPSIIRTEKLKKEWLPICKKALRRVSNNLGGSAFGIEEILFRQIVKDIRALGFEKAHRKWGTYVFGKAGDSARVVHIGE